MGKCCNCGASLDNDALFCTECGTKVEQSQKSHCPSCGAEVDADSTFCTECGKRISREPTPTPASQSQPQVTQLQTGQAIPSYQEEEKDEKRKYIIIGCIVATFLICILGWFAYQQIAGNNTAEAVEDVEYAPISATFHGSIDKYPITMELDFDGLSVSGTYYYNKQGPDKRLNLSGLIKDNKMELFETDENGVQTGHFRGTHSPGEFEGEFINAKGKSMYFKVVE